MRDKIIHSIWKYGISGGEPISPYEFKSFPHCNAPERNKGGISHSPNTHFSTASHDLGEKGRFPKNEKKNCTCTNGWFLLQSREMLEFQPLCTSFSREELEQPDWFLVEFPTRSTQSCHRKELKMGAWDREIGFPKNGAALPQYQTPRGGDFDSLRK